MISGTTVVFFLFSAVSAYTASLLIYRLIFHPLSKLPGPILAATTKWYEFYYDIVKSPGGQFFREVERMHEKYGPIVRINPDEVHVKDSSWIGTIYVNPADGARDKYAPAAHMSGMPLGSFGTIDHKLHRRRRAPLLNFFSKSAIEAAQEGIYSRANKLANVLSRQINAKGYADVRSAYLAFATDVITQHCFRSDLCLLDDDSQAEEYLATFHSIALLTPIAKQFSWLLPRVMKLPAWIGERLSPRMALVFRLFQRMRIESGLAVANHSKFVEKSMKEDSGQTKSHLDMFQTLLSSPLPAEEKHSERMAQEGYTFIVAGGETTSRVLSHLTFFVLSNRSIWIHLKEELTAVFSDEHEPGLRQLERLPWLSAIIKETLRHIALVTSRLPLVAPNEVLRYSDWAIPAGNAVSMTLADVLLDSTIFEDPLEFRPERWLSRSPQLDKMSRYWVPFSRGSRQCPGMNLAMAELYISTATLFHQLDLKLYDTVYERDIEVKKDCFLGEPSNESRGVRVTLG